jgi:hypothetical protein
MGISSGRMNSLVRFVKDTQVSDGMGGFDLTPVTH